MGILNLPSRARQAYEDRDRFGIDDERLHASSIPRYRGACHLKEDSGTHHSFPFVICRVGLLHNAMQPQLLQENANGVKTVKGSEKADEKRDGPLALSAKTAAEELERQLGRTNAGNFTNKVSFDKIQQSGLGTRDSSLGAGSSANVESKPSSQPAVSRRNQLTVHGTPRERSVQDIVEDNVKIYTKDLITKLFQDIISDFITKVIQEILSEFIEEYIKTHLRVFFDVFRKQFSKNPSKDFFDNLFVDFNNEFLSCKTFSQRPTTESQPEEEKPSVRSFESDVNPAEVPLPPSPEITPVVSPTKKREHGAASVLGSREKRQRDDSDEDVADFLSRIKKARGRNKKVAVFAQRRDANGIELAVVTQGGDRPSTFDVSRWFIVNWQSLTFASSRNAQDPQPEIEASPAVTKPHPATVQSAPLFFISILQPALRQLDNRDSSFASAIHKFDKLIQGCDALARFRKDPSRCLANNKDGIWCNSRYRTPLDVQPTVRKLLADLTRMDFESWPLYCVYNLMVLTNIAVCPYQRTMIRERVTALRQVRQLDRPYDKDLTKYLPQFLPYRPPESARLTVNQFVLQQALEPFEVDPNHGKELGEGYLYVYWNEATFGVRKIGYTTWKVGDRLKKWEAQCKHVAIEQYSSPRKVRHAARVEQLVHADLMHYRVYEPTCHACFKSHIEWFRGADLSFLIERIEAWSRWISEGPYQVIDKQWHLTDKGRDSMPAMKASKGCLDTKEHVKSGANQSRRHSCRPRRGRKLSL